MTTDSPDDENAILGIPRAAVTWFARKIGIDPATVDATMLRLIIIEWARRDFSVFFALMFPILSPDGFKNNWHYAAMAYHLEQLRHGTARWIGIAAPPRSGKSLMSSIAWPLFLLGLDPRTRIMVISHSQTLANTLSNTFRIGFRSSLYRLIFPETEVNPRKDSEAEVGTTAGGYRLAISAEGTVTGRGGDVIIVDDGVQPDDTSSEARREAFNHFMTRSMSTRSNDKDKEAFAIIMQRLRVDDPIGYIQDRLGEEFRLLSLPAVTDIDRELPIGLGRTYLWKAGEKLHPALFDDAFLDRRRTLMGPANFSAQYLQAPQPDEGNVIDWSWFGFDEAEPVRQPGDHVLISFDTALKTGQENDYSVGFAAILRGNHYHVIDMIRGRWGFPDLVQHVVAFCQKHQPTHVMIEESPGGIALIEHIRSLKIPRLRNPFPVKPLRDKIERAQMASLPIRAGQVSLPRHARWLEELKAESSAFPRGRHDDMVDALVHLINEGEEIQARFKRVSIPQGPIIIG
jgi:predicted phage terminase large subunit-like protein